MKSDFFLKNPVLPFCALIWSLTLQALIHFPDGGNCQLVQLPGPFADFPAVDADRSKPVMDSLQHSLSGILIIVCTTCKESSHFSPLLQIIRVSLYMLLIDSICERNVWTFPTPYTNSFFIICITLPPEVVLIQIRSFFFFIRMEWCLAQSAVHFLVFCNSECMLLYFVFKFDTV